MINKYSGEPWQCPEKIFQPTLETQHKSQLTPGLCLLAAVVLMALRDLQ